MNHIFTIMNRFRPRGGRFVGQWLVLALLFCSIESRAADFLVEAESFADKGGWQIDQQFMDQMGSPYLIAHGLGQPVADAMTEVDFPQTGRYYVYARTYNWTSPWQSGVHDSPQTGPGAFQIIVGKKTLQTVVGVTGQQWEWQLAGSIDIRDRHQTVRLHDLRGFDGRCDALYFTTDQNPVLPDDAASQRAFRQPFSNNTAEPLPAGDFDLVVVGAGIAGMCTAMAAARLGCNVALISDRPLLGGNNSSEVRVHLGGHINLKPYPRLGDMLTEFGPAKGGNAQPAERYEDQKKTDWIASEPRIRTFYWHHATGVIMKDRVIETVITTEVTTGQTYAFRAPLFADCTGDGCVGFLAGADYMMGREGRSEFNEPLAPEQADKMTMGTSVQWYTTDAGRRIDFPVFDYGVHFSADRCEDVTMGEWTWETGMRLNTIDDAERIRDYGMLVIYSNWSFLKNHKPYADKYRNRQLSWVAYVGGKRESRRLLGDYVLKQDDLDKRVFHEDGTACTSWSMDLHVPDPGNEQKYPEGQFISTTTYNVIHSYPVPYRCLYSRNVDNLFMAGRNISATHVAMGSTRVMRTCGMLGEVVGMAASICNRHGVMPRDVYQHHLPELQKLMTNGVGKPDPNNKQNYNTGETLDK